MKTSKQVTSVTTVRIDLEPEERFLLDPNRPEMGKVKSLIWRSNEEYVKVALTESALSMTFSVTMDELPEAVERAIKTALKEDA